MQTKIIFQMVEDDGLPSQICTQCLLNVHKSFAFKQQCERADSTIRHYIKVVF